MDCEAQAADRQNPKSPPTGSAVSAQKIAPQPWCRQGVSGRSCELWSGRPASVADQALEAGGCAAIGTHCALPHWNLSAGTPPQARWPVGGGPSGSRDSTHSRRHPARTRVCEDDEPVAEAARHPQRCAFGLWICSGNPGHMWEEISSHLEAEENESRCPKTRESELLLNGPLHKPGHNILSTSAELIDCTQYTGSR